MDGAREHQQISEGAVPCAMDREEDGQPVSGFPRSNDAALRGKHYGVKSWRLGEERFQEMGFLDIMRESSTLLRANSSLYMSIMAALICPVSAVILSRVLVNGMLASRLSRRFEDVGKAIGLFGASLNRVVCFKLSETVISYTFCFPVFITLWLLAKAATMYTVACTYAGTRSSVGKFLSVALKLWKRLFVTYLWVCVVTLGLTGVVVLFLLLVASFFDALEFSVTAVLLAEVVVGVVYSVIFANMMVIGNLANVVAVLEEYSGGAALLRSLFLIKGRTQIALLLFLLTAISTAMVESLFQYRVIGIESSTYPTDNTTRLWEGPLLVFMYSFLYLYDAIMSCVFYFTCKSSYVGSNEKNNMLEHISIGLDLADQ